MASDWTVIFGPSGSGKSTLLRLLAGLDRGAIDRTSRSRIALDGRPLADASRGLWLRPGNRQTAMGSAISILSNEPRELKKCWNSQEPRTSSIVVPATSPEEKPSALRSLVR